MIRAKTNEQKENHEKEIFLGFIDAANLPIDPASVRNRQPRYPDIECATLAGDLQGFELGEVQWHDHAGEVQSSAHAEAISAEKAQEKANLIAAGRHVEAEAIQTCVGFRSPLWGPFLRMFDQKCEKRYETDGYPVSLLLIYERESPYQPFDDLFDVPLCDAICHMMNRSQFSDVWLYHHPGSYEMRLPDMTAREGLVFRAPLASFVSPAEQRRVIGRMRIREGELAMTFDASFNDGFGKGIRLGDR
jgi:hypothetical protein